MTMDLATVQEIAQHYANDRNLAITSGDGLRAANVVFQGLTTPGYRMFGIPVGRRWPEYARIDTSLSTVQDQEEYTWITSPVFREGEFQIEIIDSGTSEPDPPLIPCPDLETWNRYDFSSSATPIFYRLFNDSGTVKLALRPTPDTGSETIRVTGQVEATDFTAPTDETIFLNTNADHAFAILIAADIKAKRGDLDDAVRLARQAHGLLPRYDYNPMIRESGRMRPHPM